MSMSLEPARAIWLSLLLYDLRVNLKRHVIALLYRYELAIVVVAFCGGDNHEDATMMMEIKGARKGYTMSHIMNCI